MLRKAQTSEILSKTYLFKRGRLPSSFFNSCSNLKDYFYID